MLLRETVSTTPTTTFHQALLNALNVPTIIAVLISGILGGFVIASAHRFANTDISPRMVAVLGSTLMASLQVASDVGSTIYRPTNGVVFAGGHLGYFILSLISGLGCWPGAALARRFFLRPHPTPELPTVTERATRTLHRE